MTNLYRSLPEHQVDLLKEFALWLKHNGYAPTTVTQYRQRVSTMMRADRAGVVTEKYLHSLKSPALRTACVMSWNRYAEFMKENYDVEIQALNRRELLELPEEIEMALRCLVSGHEIPCQCLSVCTISDYNSKSYTPPGMNELVGYLTNRYKLIKHHQTTNDTYRIFYSGLEALEEIWEWAKVPPGPERAGWPLVPAGPGADVPMSWRAISVAANRAIQRIEDSGLPPPSYPSLEVRVMMEEELLKPEEEEGRLRVVEPIDSGDDGSEEDQGEPEDTTWE
jgi:hypothetical protein